MIDILAVLLAWAGVLSGYTPPIVIPPGVVLHARLINNSNEAQWMNAQVVGWLVPTSLAPTAYDVWEQVR